MAVPEERPSSQPAYELLGKLAEGAVAEVFLARAAGGAEVVLKVVRPELAGDAEVTDRFLDEARLVAGFDHPHIIRHLGAGRLPDGRLYLATERLEGIDLRTRLARGGPLSPAAALALAAPLCAALDYLHARGVFHRDLKPDNVFLAGAEQWPVLLDFGLAHFRGPRLAATGAGSAPFTPAYAAPECIEGRAPDARSDVYSLAVVLFEALAGHVPFSAARHEDLLAAQLHDPPPPLPAGCEALAPAISRALAKDPADRFPSADAFAAALAGKHELEQTHLSATALTPLPLSEPLEKAGDVLGSYEIMDLIGEGGMGRVFVAKHVALGRRVALKVLKPEQAQKRDSVARFFSEARAVNQINHEHIVEVIDFVDDREKRRVYCVMELLAGKPLGQLLREEKLTVRRAVHIAWQVGDALKAAHAAGVVHRDVKPDNVFLIQRSGIQDYVKVLDFGVAKLAAGPDGGPVTTTREGSILGTPTHMAPEQFLGGEVDRRADVYAFGVLLYQMLAGRLPFEGDDFGQLSAQVVRAPAPKLGARTPLGERIPRSLRRLVRRCLAKDPEDRPQSMDEISAVLLPLLAPPSPWPRRTLWGAAALSLAAAAALAWPHLPAAWTHRALPPPPAPPLPATVALTITSSPPGASVTRVDTGQALGVTPLHAILPRAARDLPLHLELAGYAPVDRTLRTEADVLWDAALVSLAPPPPAPAPAPAAAARPHLRGLDDTLPPYAHKSVPRAARSRAEAAQIAYDVGHFGRALELFSLAYEFAPQPSLLFDIAQCHRQLGHAERALFFYRRYLARAPAGADLHQARKLIEKVKEMRSDAQAQWRERLDAQRREGEVEVLRAKEAAAKAEAKAAASEAAELRAREAAKKKTGKRKAKAAREP
ncbi:MAG TPA: protein kinase [Myxococcales bacterium]|nr:protein kinase [Myxococcales bacterium]